MARRVCCAGSAPTLLLRTVTWLLVLALGLKAVLLNLLRNMLWVTSWYSHCYIPIELRVLQPSLLLKILGDSL